MHKLLSGYTESKLREAARYSGVSKAIKAALLSLANESSGNDRNEPRIADRPRRLRDGKTSQTPSFASDQVLNAIRSSPYFESTASIVEFAKGMGIKI